jgi:PKD repeat protein
MNFCNRFIIFTFTFFWYVSLFSQTLSGILPKYDATISEDSVTFFWNEDPNADYYNVFVSSSPDFTVGTFVSPNLLTESWSFSIPNGGTWYWKVKATSATNTWFGEIEKFRSFSPSHDDGLILWLKADSGLTIDASGNVQQWADLSPSGNLFTQTNAVKRPSVMSVSFGGFPSLTFSGTQWLSGGDVLDIGTSSRSMFVVGRMSGANQSIFAKSIAANAPNRYALIKDGTQTALIYQETAEKHVYSSQNSTDFSLYSSTINRIGGVNSLSLNNAALGQNSISPSYNMNSSSRFLIGAYNNSSDNSEVLLLNGNISEIIFLNSSDEAKQDSVLSYVKHKYHNFNLGADIFHSNDFCASSLAVSSEFSVVSWNTGETTSTITVTNSGYYSVIVRDRLGFVWNDTILVQFPTIQTPDNNFICVGQNSIWSAGLGSTYTYLWNTGATNESITITTPGTYSVTVTDGLGCTRTSDPITFSVDYYENTAFLGADTSLCTGNPLALQVGATETVSYAWQGGAASTQATYPVGPTGNYWVQSVNVNGCVARDTIFITNVGTAPIAEFTVQDHCKDRPAPIVDQSTGVGSDFVAQWQWDMGNGVVINQQIPNYTYPSAGVYPVELYVQSAGGCGAYHYDTIEVFANPTAVYSFTGHCAGQEVQFTDASQVGSTPISTYTWNFDMPSTGAYNTSNIPIPNRIFEDVGSYDVKLVVTDGYGCKDSIVQTVQIDPTPVPNFVFESTCQGSPIQFLNTSNTQPSSAYLWDFGDNTSSIIVNPQHTYPDYGINEVSLSVTNLYSCTAILTQSVEVYAFPLTSLQIGPACMDSYVTLENTSNVPLGAIDSTLWVINQTDTISGADAAWMVNALGQQQVELFTWSTQGCASQTSQFFDVDEQFNASFTTYPGIIAAGQPFTFENTSNAGSIALWTFGDGGFSTDFSPEHTFDMTYADSTLQVLLIAMNPSGCVDSSLQQVQIQRAKIDLEISNLFLQKDGNWYVMGVSLKNKGTVDLQNAALVVETPKGLLFNETWNGVLKPTEDSIYVFSAMPTSIFNDQDGIESYVCVNGQAFDIYGTAETYLENNKVCRNVEGESIVLLPVFPNPISKDFTVRIYLSNSAEVFLSLDDARGRSVQSMETGNTLNAGYYEYAVDADRLAEGTYYINLRSGGETKSFRVSVIK